jgi:hypothetical protein
MVLQINIAVLVIKMRKGVLFFIAMIAIFPAYAQWAVYDKEVYDQLVLVNKIRNLDGLGSNKTYDHYQSERDDATGDIKMGGGVSLATLKSLQTKFEEADAVPDLTKEEMAKYVGTEADCGQKETNLMHYNACMGLRNLRLQTLVQSHAMLKNLAKRREEIVALIRKARQLTDGHDPSLGQLQRATFEIQGQQALMQADALQIKILMDGYKQREVMYITQQDEARKSALNKAMAERKPRPPRFFSLTRDKPAND